MARALIILRTLADRARAKMWIERAKDGSRIEFKGPQRTVDQNNRMWAMLTDFADQVVHFDGRKHKPHVWKSVFMHELGIESEYVPSLDGTEIVAIGLSSRDLSVEEMSGLIEIIFREGYARGVIFSDPKIPQNYR